MNVYIVVSGTKDIAKVFNGFTYAGAGKFSARWNPIKVSGSVLATAEAYLFSSWAEAVMITKQYGGQVFQLEIDESGLVTEIR